MSDAPVCGLTGASPPASTPARAKGFQQIPPTATLHQAINIINNNFVRLAPQTTTNLAPRSFNDGNWGEINRVTQLVRISNPEDPSQFVDVEQINHLVMQDRITGATWIWNRNH